MNQYHLLYYCHPDTQAMRIGDECPHCGASEVFVSRKIIGLSPPPGQFEFLVHQRSIDAAIFNQFKLPRWIIGINEHDRQTIKDCQDNQGESGRPYPMPEEPEDSPRRPA